MIRLGCVGLGYWGPNILRAFLGLRGCEVRWACDQDEGRLKKIGGAHPQVSLASHYEELLQDPELDALSIATPATMHYSMAKAALEAGKHVLVEKPLAMEIGEAKELIELAERRSRILMVGHLLLYHPAVRKLKNFVEAQELGEIY
ncbi:MAG: Gfo/Idh/MocA family oxidoreductase, partial [candidate division NC10 bacterium]|nr:Gfo/Idh/MocA family oxidoreductase [candidate division NC10 bacterium]